MISVRFDVLLIFSVLATALHWTVARAEITAPLWSRAHGWLGALLRCPACSGFWLGLGLYTCRVRPITFEAFGWGPEMAMHGFLGLFVTPILEALFVTTLAIAAIPDADQSASSSSSSFDNE